MCHQSLPDLRYHVFFIVFKFVKVECGYSA